MEPETSAKILEWMRRTGYPLELEVGRRFQAAAWHVNYSRWYRDKSTEKARELDVQALVGAVDGSRASVFLSLCMECKSTKEKPWVALSSGLTLGDEGLLSCAIGYVSRMTLVAARTE